LLANRRGTVPVRTSGLRPRCVRLAPWFPASLRRVRGLCVSPPRASYFFQTPKK